MWILVCVSAFSVTFQDNSLAGLPPMADLAREQGVLRSALLRPLGPNPCGPVSHCLPDKDREGLVSRWLCDVILHHRMTPRMTCHSEVTDVITTSASFVPSLLVGYRKVYSVRCEADVVMTSAIAIFPCGRDRPNGDSRHYIGKIVIAVIHCPQAEQNNQRREPESQLPIVSPCE